MPNTCGTVPIFYCYCKPIQSNPIRSSLNPNIIPMYCIGENNKIPSLKILCICKPIQYKSIGQYCIVLYWLQHCYWLIGDSSSKTTEVWPEDCFQVKLFRWSSDMSYLGDLAIRRLTQDASQGRYFFACKVLPKEVTHCLFLTCSSSYTK
jgi:hypothetical protein